MHRQSGTALSKEATEAASHVCCPIYLMALAQDGRCYRASNLALVLATQGTSSFSQCGAARTGGRDAACNLTFPVTLGPLAQLELQFSGVRDNAAVAGIQVSGPMAPSFKIQSFLQSDTASASPARGERSHAQTLGQMSFGHIDFSWVMSAGVSPPQEPHPSDPPLPQMTLLSDCGPVLAGKALLRIDTGRDITAGNYTADNNDVWTYDKLYQGKATFAFS